MCAETRRPVRIRRVCAPFPAVAAMSQCNRRGLTLKRKRNRVERGAVL
jgi:hypothetical protein